jgi:Transcriptional regulator containing an amidase domain and an AraC-type DNA-binding HTH domain
MGYSLHAVQSLGAPFVMVDESVFVIPRQGVVRLGKHHFKLLFILDGRIEHEIDGVEGRRKLEPGDILVAPPVRHHVYINSHPRKSVPVHVVRMFLDAEHLATRARRRVRRPESDLSDYVLHHFSKVEQITGGIDNEITDLLASLRREVDAKAPGYRHRVRALCTSLIVAVSRKSVGARVRSLKPKGTPSGHIVVAAKEYILKNLERDISLGEVAWHVGKGEEHLARVFKRETGRSVFDYVREVRVNRAQTHLLDPSLSLTEIAEKCGFNSLSFFSRTFRQLTGMSPTAYRRQTQAEIQPQR